MNCEAGLDPLCAPGHPHFEPGLVPVRYELSNSVGFGGQQASLLLGLSSAPQRVSGSVARGAGTDAQFALDQQGLHS